MPKTRTALHKDTGCPLQRYKLTWTKARAAHCKDTALGSRAVSRPDCQLCLQACLPLRTGPALDVPTATGPAGIPATSATPQSQALLTPTEKGQAVVSRYHHAAHVMMCEEHCHGSQAVGLSKPPTAICCAVYIVVPPFMASSGDACTKHRHQLCLYVSAPPAWHVSCVLPTDSVIRAVML